MLNFLWSGRDGEGKYHWAKWQKICLPKVFGGWEIKKTYAGLVRLSA